MDAREHLVARRVEIASTRLGATSVYANARQHADAAMLATTPPPPSPPPSLPLEVGDPRCLDLGLGSLLGSARYTKKAIFSAFGGSNTQGANAKALNPRGGTIYGPNIPSFAHLLAARLRRSHDAQWNADGGSGPMFAGACASHFIPPNTRLGTIEYLPNMGYIKEDHAEVAAVRSMLRMMAARGAAAFVVNIVSGTKRYENDARGGGQGAACKRLGWKEELVGCMGRERILHFRDLLARAANETGAHVVTIDADEAPHLFGADSFHLNRNGHKTVFNEIWRILRALPCADRHAGDASAATSRTEADDDIGVSCALGDELAPHVGRAVGFGRADLAPAGKAPKIGWVANASGASLALCARLPRALRAERERVVAERVFLNSKDRAKMPLRAGAPYRISVGLQASHPRNRPLFGVARVDCAGACNCTCDGAGEAVAAPPGCRVDTLSNSSSVTITTYLNLNVAEVEPPSTPESHAGCAPDACVVRVTNAERGSAAEARAKVVVRAMIVGLNDWRTMQLGNAGIVKRSGLEGVRRN